MEFATGALGSLAPKLGQLLQDEYKLQKGTKKDVEFLEGELESVRAALWNIGEVPPEQVNELLLIWARDVRDLSYDMEDIVDTFLVRVEGPKHLSVIKEMMKKITKATTRRGIAQEIKGIKERVKELANRRERYTINDTIRPQTTMSDPRLHALYTKATNLVGIEKAREELIIKLTKIDDMSMQQPRIVSIVGIGGLGKTTLAKAVYDELKVAFNCSAFVTLSQNPDTKKILRDMLYELDVGVYKNIHGEMLDEKHLIDLVQKFLLNKRYIIVIDDIWEPCSWETIKLALPEKCGSIIIATTRKFEAAIEVGEIYKLPPLSYDHSKKLFNTRIFGFEGKCMDDQQDEVSNKFLKKCDGIPLAIITMASLLVGKPRETWDEVYTAIGFGHKDNMQVENTMRILSFSYYDMPSHLRTCFLYLSAFPEDYVIDKYSLIWKWIAEGFIHEEQGKVLFELGEQYFSELINRSMIQAVESEDNVEVKGCRVHDMILDFVRSVSQEENFITVLDNREGISSQNKYKLRRLAFHKITMEHITSQIDQEDMPKVRTYIASICSINQQVALLGFKLLRVLAIEGCRFNKDCQLENIGNLTHLRYLSLRYTRIRDDLPEQIGNLKFLQTIDLYHTWIKQLPASIIQLTQLVCLLAGSLEVLDRMGNLTSLQQLTLYISWRSKDVEIIRKFVKVLGNLTELRMLEIANFWIQGIKMDESLQRDLVESLGKLHKIQHIELHSFEYSTSDGTWEGVGFVLPQHLRHLSLSFIVFPSLLSCVDVSRLYHLSFLELSVIALDEFDLKLLGRLTELRYLNLDIRIKVNATVSNINARDGFFFPKLTFCKIHGAMVQFEHNEDSSFSFHIWDGIDIDHTPFGSRRYRGYAGISSAIMPKVEVLQFDVYVEPVVLGQFGYCNTIGWEYLTSLRKVMVNVCVDSSYRGGTWEEVGTALREAINGHPNRPTFEGQGRWFYGRY